MKNSYCRYAPYSVKIFFEVFFLFICNTQLYVLVTRLNNHISSADICFLQNITHMLNFKLLRKGRPGESTSTLQKILQWVRYPELLRKM